MEWITRSGLKIGVFPALKALAPGLEVFIATRGGGVSPEPFDSLNLGGNLGDPSENIARNRELFLEAVRVPKRRLALTGQVHGSKIAVVNAGGVHPGFDGLLTTRRDLALAISTADCLSVVLYSPPERVLVALHVGRRGAESGIIDKAASILTETYRIDPTYAIAIVGPGICKRCYTISKEDASSFPRAVKRYDGNAWHLDLERFCRMKLRENGLKGRNILSSRLCSACDHELFFSHRRDHHITGRLWTLAVIRSDPGLSLR